MTGNAKVADLAGILVTPGRLVIIAIVRQQTYRPSNDEDNVHSNLIVAFIANRDLPKFTHRSGIAKLSRHPSLQREVWDGSVVVILRAGARSYACRE